MPRLHRTRRSLPCLVLAVGVALAAWPPAASAGQSDLPSNAWSRVDGPTSGASRVIGSAAHGCLAGAVRLPADGPGYQAIRLSRKRYFGDPDLIAFIEDLGRRAQASGLPTFYVGDMAQARGGPLPYGHASHQTGLDVDIWFGFASKRLVVPAAREAVDLPSMLQANWRAIDPKRFGPGQVMLLRLAAADPHVDRIFVNPAIKTALCHGYGGATQHGHTWLQRIRPWYGHDEHFHVRLRCPAGSPDCTPQAPLPPGDGCDGILASWLRHQSPPPPPPPLSAMRPRNAAVPAACHALLGERPHMAKR